MGSQTDSGLEKEHSFVFDAKKPPVRKVAQNEKFVVSTRDAVNGQIRSENVLFTAENLAPMSQFHPELSNPVYGPVFVQGVRKDDLLAINIHSIRPAARGVTGIKLSQGLFHDSRRWQTIYREPRSKILEIDIARQSVKFSSHIAWELKPFIGTIGVAPEYEIHASSVIQTPWAGNWDCRHICAGATLYVNACNDGGLLYVGDVHGSQGDGELSGIANEIEADIELSVHVVSKTSIPYARIENEDEYICICSAKPLESAVQNAIDYLLTWLSDLVEVDLKDIFMVFSSCPNFQIDVYQMVDMPGFFYTAGARITKALLPAKDRQ